MQRHIALAAAGFGLVVGASGCSNFLDAPKAVADPNAPTAATVNQLLPGIEANIFGEQEGSRHGEISAPVEEVAINDVVDTSSFGRAEEQGIWKSFPGCKSLQCSFIRGVVQIDRGHAESRGGESGILLPHHLQLGD